MDHTSPTLWRRFDATGVPLLIARLVVGVLFVWMGVNKVEDPVLFLKLVRQYHIVPESPGIYLNTIALALPWLEIMCGLALILGIALRGSALVTAVMLVVFTPVIFVRALDIMQKDAISFFAVKFDCGCGGGEVVIWTKLLENTGLFALTLIALFSRSQRFLLSNLWTRQKGLIVSCPV